jgi:hypothetical protein
VVVWSELLSRRRSSMDADTLHVRIIWNASSSASAAAARARVVLYENGTGGGMVGGEYDHQGALAYIVFVVIVYGICIIMLIPSSAQINHHENALQRYMLDIERARKLAWRQEKFKTRLVIHRQSWSRILGSDRAEIIVEDPSRADIERRASFPTLDSRRNSSRRNSSRRNSSLTGSGEDEASDASDTTTYKVENERHERRSSITIQTIDWSGDTFEIISQHTVPLLPSPSTAPGRETFLPPATILMERRRAQFLSRKPLATLPELRE